MAPKIKKAAVLGSGVMGMAIAGHLAGCGIKVRMLDIVPFDNMLSDAEKAKKDTDKKVRNKLGLAALKMAMKWKPPQSAFYSKSDANLIEIGNFDDDFEKIGDCDWIIEVVVERMDIKKDILAKIEKYAKADAILSTNTSGLSVEAMTEDCGAEFKKRFMGTHFFNPVRFMKLLEIIPHPDTDPELLKFMEGFCAETLGKGVIWAKDTPNFIANRIGVHGMMYTMHLMVEDDYRIDEVDAIVGKPMGRPKTAAYATADLVGLDTLKHVAETVYETCPDDPDRDFFKPPEFMAKLVADGNLGKKTGKGFYAKGPKRERLVLDYKTGEYIPAEKFKYDSIGAAKAGGPKALMVGDDRAAQFAWKVTRKSLTYTASKIPEIADRVVEVDRGMRWGFNFKKGPFESWDEIGVRESVERMKADGIEVPENVLKMLEAGAESFYKKEDGKLFYYDLINGGYKEVEPDPMIVRLDELADDKKVWGNDGATLWNLDDGALALEFHTKMNAIDNEVIDGINKFVDYLEDGSFKAGVIANHGTNFSVGANIVAVMALFNQDGGKDMVVQMVKGFQDANMRMKYCKSPIVAAPAGMALGGGCEICLHAHKVVGAAETYMGLVEVGVGLLPAGGGTKEFVMRGVEGLPPGVKPSLLPFAQKAFENIATAKVGVGFKETQDLGILRKTDIMVPNADYRIFKAKEVALGMAAGPFDPGEPATAIPVAGINTLAAFKIAVEGMFRAGWATPHDRTVSGEISPIIAGGQRAEWQTISEQELLDMEIDGFMTLLANPLSQERIFQMVSTGKPLRN
jgi:3-hydroxyacyl-CoA dehydrogenase